MGDRSLPEPNKIITLRHQLNSHAQHQSALNHMKPVLNTTTDQPHRYNHLNKRDKAKQIKISTQAAIQHDNIILLNKMKSIINNPCSTLYTPPYQLSSLNYTNRKHEFQRISNDNNKLYTKIEAMKSQCSKSKQLTDYDKSRQYITNMSKFPPHIQRIKLKYTQEIQSKYRNKNMSSNEIKYDWRSIDTVNDKLNINSANCIYSECNIPVQYNNTTLQCILSVYTDKTNTQSIDVIGNDEQKRSDLQPVTLSSTLLRCMQQWTTNNNNNQQIDSIPNNSINDILQCFEFINKNSMLSLQVKQSILDEYTTSKFKSTRIKSPTSTNKSLTVHSPITNRSLSSTNKPVALPQSLHADSALQNSSTNNLHTEIVSGPLSSIKNLFTSKSSAAADPYTTQQYNISFNVSINTLPNKLQYPMVAVYHKLTDQSDYTFVTQTERLHSKSNTAASFVTKLQLNGQYQSTNRTIEYMFSLYNASNETTVSEDDIVATKVLTLNELIELVSKQTISVSLQLNIINSDKLQNINIEMNNIVYNTNIDVTSIKTTNKRASNQPIISTNGYNVHVSCNHINTKSNTNLMCALYASDQHNEYTYIGQSDHVKYNENPIFHQPIQLSSDTLSSSRRQLMFTVYAISDINKIISESDQLCTTQCITIHDLMSLLSITQDKQTVVLPLIKHNKLFDSAQITLKLVPI